MKEKERVENIVKKTKQIRKEFRWELLAEICWACFQVQAMILLSQHSFPCCRENLTKKEVVSKSDGLR